MTKDYGYLKLLSAQLRKKAFEICRAAKSGHVGASSSSTELMVALYFHALNYDLADSKHSERDRVLVRGHLGPLRYGLFSSLNWIKESELNEYRNLGSRLQGHESMSLPGVDLTPSGSLGMLLSYGTGAALAAKQMKKDFLTYVFLGDGEEQEGNVSEAARQASNQGLDNLICILDKNGKQLSRPTNDNDSHANVRLIWEGYGWDVREIKDGNSFEDVIPIYDSLKRRDRPTLIIANTIKGKHLPGAEDNPCGYHTISSCRPEVIEKGISTQEAIINSASPRLFEKIKKIKKSKRIKSQSSPFVRPKTEIEVKNNFGRDNLVDTWADYVREVQQEMEKQNTKLYFLTADLVRKDQVAELGIRDPSVYIDVGIREQHMIGLAHGISQTDPHAKILINAGDAFLYRSLDQLHASAQAKSPMVIIGDDGGICGGKNGSTHQTSGQPGALTTMPGIRFLEPADNQDLVNCLNLAFTEYDMPTYIRLHNMPIKDFNIGERNTEHYSVFESKGKKEVTLVSSGMIVDQCIEAAKLLEKKGIGSRVVNVVNPRKLGKRFNKLILDKKPCLCVYNGNPFVLTSAVSDSVLSQEDRNTPTRLKGHGFEIGTSGSLEDLIKHFRFTGEEIAKQVITEFF